MLLYGSHGWCFSMHQMAGQKAVFPITIFDAHLLTLSEQMMHGTLVKFQTFRRMSLSHQETWRYYSSAACLRK